MEIRLEGPGKNALSRELLEHVRASLRAAGGRPVLLTGAGDAFSAGLHLKQVAALDAAGMRSFLELVDTTFAELSQYPGPAVACVNGHAIAGGAVLALCCDHRVCTDDARARIGLNEVALGVRFPPRTLAIVRRRVGDRVLLGAELFPPREALAVGLVDEVSSEYEALARRRLDFLAGHPAEAYRATKAALRGACPQDLVDEETHQRALQEALPAWTSDATRARILAVLSK